ncbi:hypothetical protein [Desulfonema magnum]|uniref:Uncharacterized protein n=1 Tax=Desulfonema magnum TaxID=45655 RepID=A0A975GP89_9BACT|nr:hypothetical protein [Desulfonema magnum]QTA88587.1 Uncharacterized protein dnm_046340 [Desulfonema magnum]
MSENSPAIHCRAFFAGNHQIFGHTVDRKSFQAPAGRQDGRGRNPAFSGGSDTSSGEKAGFLCCPEHSPETFRSTDTYKMELKTVSDISDSRITRVTMGLSFSE